MIKRPRPLAVHKQVATVWTEASVVHRAQSFRRDQLELKRAMKSSHNTLIFPGLHSTVHAQYNHKLLPSRIFSECHNQSVLRLVPKGIRSVQLDTGMKPT
jgi:hypothetical protein